MRFYFVGSYATTATSTVLATRAFVGVLFQANSPNLSHIGTGSSGHSNVPAYDWRSNSSDIVLYDLQSRSLKASVHVPEKTVTSFSFLTQDDPRIITTNPQTFALELWIVKGSTLEKAGILELPSLTSAYECEYLQCAPLDTTESANSRQSLHQEPKTAVIIDFRLSPTRTPHVNCITGQFIVSTAFLLSFPLYTVDLRRGPITMPWNAWGIQNAHICEGALNTNNCNPFSGHYFTTHADACTSHPSLVSVYDVRRPWLSPPVECRLRNELYWGAEFVPHVFRQTLFARSIDQEVPAYELSFPSERLFYYEGWLYSLRYEGENVLITICSLEAQGWGLHELDRELAATWLNEDMLYQSES